MYSNEQLREKLYGLLGRLPDRHRPLKVEKKSEEIRPNYILETLLLDLNGMEDVPAYMARPLHADGKLPLIVYNHSHGGYYSVGKDELLSGQHYLQDPPYAEVLTQLGYAVICIDAWAFGERSTRSELDLFKSMLWHGQVMWGMMVYDTLRLIDYAVDMRNDIDAGRIGTLGMSMGSSMAWWTAALDPRIKVCVDICCLTDFQTLLELQGLQGHGIYYYVPDLLNHFTTAQINALIAPRAHLGLAGNQDPLTPAKGLDKIDRALKSVYRQEGEPDQWKMLRFEGGHQETETMRKEVLRFLQEKL